jgi:hypothetical protein
MTDEYKILAAKIEEICNDLSNNVTKIFLRADLHLAFLIGYCSVLHYDLDGEINYGIIDCLLTGDSSQGKSKISKSLITYFGLGEIHNFGAAKRTGLIGGIVQVGSNKKWFIKWGALPLNDRQLVVLEELKGGNEEVIANLRSLRSDKEAEILGIVNRIAPARTRLVMISNPRSSKKDVASYDFGIKIIKELMVQLEDVRRLDFAMVVSREEMDEDKRDELIKNNIHGTPKFSEEAWRKLILWIWTRSVDQVVFEEGFRENCLELSKKLYKTFTETIPLVDSGSMRHKLTKIAASIAAMTFSTEGKNYEKLLVKKVHLEYAFNFLMKIYSSETCGYKSFSEDDRYSKVLRADDITFLRKRLKETKYPRDLVEHMLHADQMDRFSLMDWCAIVQERAQSLLGDLVRRRAIFRNGFAYEKSPGFTKLLKELLKEDDFSKERNNEHNNIDEIAEF